MTDFEMPPWLKINSSAYKQACQVSEDWTHCIPKDMEKYKRNMIRLAKQRESGKLTALRQKRYNDNLTMKDVGEMVGVASGTIRDIEQYKTRFTIEAVFKKLLKYYTFEELKHLKIRKGRSIFSPEYLRGAV